VPKRWLLVLSAAVIVAAGAAGSYALAGSGNEQTNVPNTMLFHATLSGYQETPANSTTGSGDYTARLVDDGGTPTIHFVFTYSDLEGQNVANGKIPFAHVHFGEAGFAGGVSYFLCDNSAVPVAQPCPNNNGSGTVEGDITARNVIGPNGQGIEPGSFDEILRAMRAGKAYANIHTARWMAGEIRGQINSNVD
jgi:CHRD domain